MDTNPMDEIQGAVSAFRQLGKAARASALSPPLSKYEMLRAIALRGELEAFVSNAALDYELTEDTFDKTVEIEGAAWLKRGGAI